MSNYEKNEKFLFLMAALGEAFSQEASEQKIKIYARALQDLKIEDIEKAVWNIIRTRTTATFPKIAEIRELVHGDPDEQALLALVKLEESIQKHGYYTSVVFVDKTIHMAVEALGGWQGISVMTSEEWKWKRKEFLDLYKVFSKNPREYPEKLIGYHDGNNEINGFKKYIKEPILIGDNGGQKRLQ